MRLLILGGTVFLGRHIALAAMGQGHDVTLFNRGSHPLDSDLVGATSLRGDRNGDLDALLNEKWDRVIDTSGYFPADVTASAELLSSRCHHYTFISTLSVYANMATEPGTDESGAVLTTDDPDSREITPASYGALKALCEDAVRLAISQRCLIIRPGLIVGPNDPSDRFTYWPIRIRDGGDILAPESPDIDVQFVDVRDLADWVLALAVHGTTGTFNAASPAGLFTLGSVIDSAIRVTQTQPRITWLPASWLLEHEVKPWIELPLWIPDAPGFAQADCSKAELSGLQIRSLDETVIDTLTWAQHNRNRDGLKAGLSATRESELLAAWNAERATGPDGV